MANLKQKLQIPTFQVFIGKSVKHQQKHTAKKTTDTLLG